MNETNTPAMKSIFDLPKYSISLGKQDGPFTTYEVCVRVAPGQQVVVYTSVDRPKAERVLAALNA